MMNFSKHKDKLEQNKGILMQISLMASLLIVLLLFESKSRSAEAFPSNFAEIDLLIENSISNDITKPLPNNEYKTEEGRNLNHIKAQFKGGEAALRAYVEKELIYPSDAKSKGIIGRVIVGFTVDESGKIKDAKVIRSIHPLLDTEALRIINAMPNWNPATILGKPVNSKQTLPIIFMNPVD